MQILLDGSENSIRNIVKLLDSYTEISGLKLNYNRSELAPLRKSRMEIYTHSFSLGMTITLDMINILGITMPTNGNIEDLIRYNFEEKKEKIKCIVHARSKRNLTLYGKVTISSIIPQFTYPLSVLPNPGHSYFKEIDKIILNVLWDNKPPKIKRNVVLLKHSQGGLGITDIYIYSYSKSVKFMWIKKIMENSFDSSWKNLIK
jgi:hypothetical protein